MTKNKLIQALLKKTPLTVLDIETSGMMEEMLSSGVTQRGVILQVGGVHTSGIGDKEAKPFQFIPSPAGQKVKIDDKWLQAYKESKAYTQLHGITTPFQATQGNFQSTREIISGLSKMFPFTSKGLLLGYNLKNFDLPFIQSRVGWSPTFAQQAQIMDVMSMAKQALPGLKSYALSDVATALNIKLPTGMHQSVTDSMITLEVFKKLSKSDNVGLGEVLKRIHGVQSLDQMKEQEFWHNKNIEYWRSKERAAIDGIRIPGRPTINDIDFAIPTGIRELKRDYGIDASGPIQRINERAQADVNYIKQRSAAEKAFEEEEYVRVREAEEAVYRGEHSPGVLQLAKDRSAFWNKIDPTNVSRKFLTDQLRFTDAQASILRSGANNQTLKNVFSSRMGEFELTGHLPRTEFRGDMAAGGPVTRVVNFGQYSNEPDAFFSGMLPSGKSAYITAEQQRSFMSNVFGQTRTYRFAGSGKIVSPQDLRRIRVVSPQDALSGVSDLTKFREKVEATLEQYKKEASLEKQGKLVRRDVVDPFSYRAGTPGKRGKMLETGDDEGMNLFDLMEKEESPAEVLSGDVQSSIKPELSANPTKEEMDKYAAQLTGMDLSGDQGEKFEQVSGEIVGPGADKSYYVERERFYRNRYKQLRSQYNKAFIFDFVKKPGQKKRERVLVDYHPLVKERFSDELRSMKANIIDLTDKSMEESEQIIEESIGRGGKVYARTGKKYEEITSAPIENFAQLYLRDAESKEYKLFSEFPNELPGRAGSEQIIDAYFRRIEGKKTFGLYTAAGTYLGETRGTAGVPRDKVGAAKIFEYKGKYHVGFAPSRDAFSWNRFGAIEQATLRNAREKAERAGKTLDESMMPREINNLLDLDESFRLKYEAQAQETLKKLHTQEAMDYKMISRYRYDKKMNSFIDSETGEQVDRMTADMYMANVENSYRRSSVTHGPLRQDAAKRANKIFESIKGFASHATKGPGLIIAALEVSAALVGLSALRKRNIDSEEDVSRAPYGSSTSDQRMFMSGQMHQNTARIIPEYQGAQGYTTNIDIQTTNASNVNPSELAFVMDRHARQAMGTKSGGVNVEINDNSDQADQYALQRKYADMMRT